MDKIPVFKWISIDKVQSKKIKLTLMNCLVYYFSFFVKFLLILFLQCLNYILNSKITLKTELFHPNYYPNQNRPNIHQNL